MRKVKVSRWWSWFGVLKVLPLVLAAASGSLGVLRDGMFLATGYQPPAQEQYWAYLRICFVIASVSSWLLEHKKVRELETRAKDLEDGAEITGDIDEAYLIEGGGEFDKFVLAKLSIVNLAVTSPTIREFRSRLVMPCGTLLGRAEWRKVRIRSNAGDVGDMLNDLSLENSQPLSKHCHRSGWLRFLFSGLLESQLVEGSVLIVEVMDGSGKVHELSERAWPWPTKGDHQEIDYIV